MRDTPRSVLVALLVVQALFATLHVAGKIALAELTPLALAGSRVLIATPLLLLYAWRIDRAIPARSDWPKLALLGLLGIFANQTLFLLGLNYTSATSSAILMPSIPVFTAGAALVLGVERVRGHRLAGIVLAAAGALVLLDPTRLETSSRATIGNLLILSNCLAYAFFLVLLRPLLARIPFRTFDLTVAKDGDAYRITGSISQSDVSKEFRTMVPLYVEIVTKKGAAMAQVAAVPIIGTMTRQLDLKVGLPAAPKRALINAHYDVLTRP